ncbi:TetR/AcrR family transcriptional regulator [Sulfuriroseicoccus oceanibius]|uniref:Tetracyclin repressor-like C-terminal domain-containing protein n=1 Tax=Sulfuriroseicoccus oceanibius TaxID=2707525 RepID=A0A6B3L4D0_9BACT|nr:TetR/AcrR family transcriptional regulator [Sulfuriroseicoccus oceanibius]QQL45278.1 hypothetical protein G3M56_001445 [Sulfuriroseicoccus oceanibius]
MSKTTKAKKAAKDPKSEIDHQYWHLLLTEGKRPASVYAFTQQIGIDEAEFYNHAASFDALEAAYWEQLVTETIDVLESDEDYASYDSEQKLLAFFYTFFAHAQKNRSRLVSFFPRPGANKTIALMRRKFLDWAKSVIEQGVEEGSVADRKKLTEKYPQLLFEQFRGIIEFHRKDQSHEFQDTDALIEKSVRFGADVARAGTLDSAFDLGRFLLRRFTVPRS